jgi:hypothetical protein
MYRLLDIFLTIIHLAIVLFNLFGWLPKATRRAHFISILLTAAAWFLLGIWFGIGYCPVTDWQWRVKAELGELNIPSNFIEYIAEVLTGYDFDSQFVSLVTGICFALAALLSIFVNFVLPRRQQRIRRV